MTFAIRSDAHAWHFLQEFGERNYDAAFKQVEAFLLQDQHDSEELKSTCDAVGDFLPHLSTEKAEDLLELLLTVLVKYPLLKSERAAILTHWGDLFADRETVYPNLSQMMRGYAAAYFLGPTEELSQKLLTPFLPYVYEGFRAWIEKAAREGDPDRFGSLLGAYQQKFGCNLSIQRKLYEIADEIYEQLPRGNKAKFTRFVTEIQKGKQGKLPVQEEMHLIFHFQNKLKEIREEFSQEAETRPFQHARTEAFLEFFHAMLEDAILMLGIPPCKYDVRAVGSLAREEVCPYSDLEYLILIEEEKHRPFFRKLAQIFSLQILSFGETEHSIDLFDCGRYGLQIDKQSNPADDESLIVPYDEFFTPPRELDPNASSDGIEQYYQMLKAKKSRFHSVSLHHNYVFPLSLPDLQKTASLFLEMRREEFRKQAIFQGHVCHIKYDLMEPLFHFLGDLGLFFGLEESNTLDLIEKLPLFTETSKRLLKTAVSDLYNLRVRLHLAHGGIQEEASLVPSLELTTLTDQEKESLRQVYELVLIPLYGADLEEEIDLIALALQQPNETNVALATQFVEEDHPRYYTMLSSPDHVALQRVYLDQVPDHAEALAEIPNRAGYRLARQLEEEQLQQSLERMTTDDSSSGVKIHCPLIGEKYLTVDAAKNLLDSRGHILARYENSLHRVNYYRDLHFKELPYQPLMEYAIHSLTHRIMGKATPVNTLARVEVLDKNLVYPVLISETISGEPLNPQTLLNAQQLTWLRLCEILTKPGDGRPSNYTLRYGKIYCIDNDISFMEPVVKEFTGRRVLFVSALFTLEQPLDPEVLNQFCALEPDLILTDWLQELQAQEKLYCSLFSEAELKTFYTQDKDRRFSPTLMFAKGTIATLCTQFYHLQDVLRQGVFTDPSLLLRELISLDESTQNRVGILVERNYRKALAKPFASRLKEATALRADQSMTSQKAMEFNYKTIPTFEEIQTRKNYSLEEAFKELCLLEAQKMWNQVFIIGNGEEYSLEADFSTLQDPEREKLMLKALQFLYDAKKQKPTSITLRHTQTLTPAILKTLLHPGLRSLDLSYGALVSERGSLFGASTLSQVETFSPNLERLYLEGCPSLVQPTITLPQLRRLNISRCPNLKSLNLQKAQLQELKINHSPRLKTVQVSLTPETEVGWKEIPKSVISQIAEQFYQLGKRYAEGNGVPRDPEKGLAFWEKAAAGGHKHAQEILKWNERFNENPTSLNLWSNEIGKQGAAALADALKVNQTLSSLDLGNNQIGEQGAAALADALKVNQTLSSLDLWSNEIGKQGAAALADALRVNQTLSSLDLRNNQIGSYFGKACKKLISRNKSLQDSALKAAQEGSTQLFDLLDQGVSIYSQDEEENTFLHLAAAHGHILLIQPLFDRAQNPTFPSWKNKEDKTALDLGRKKRHTSWAISRAISKKNSESLRGNYRKNSSKGIV